MKKEKQKLTEKVDSNGEKGMRKGGKLIKDMTK